jgi:GT2 family glycosyltransferase/glycosyltransferase involved in cell wall biosynthesis
MEPTVERDRAERSRPAVKTPKVSIIILNWNGYEVTRGCLASLSKIDYPNYEIVLVDNGSTDGSPEKLAAEFPGVTTIRNKTNLGFTGGNNIGVQPALDNHAEYVLLLNNDTVVEPQFLSELIRVGESDDRIGILNPKIYYFDSPARIWYAGGHFSKWRCFSSHVGVGKLDAGAYDCIREVTFITGCAFLIKTKVIQKIGLLDERFFFLWEDTDWSIRALQAGFRAIYVPSAIIWHKESFDTKRNVGKAFRDFYYARNRILLARKHARTYHWPTLFISLGLMLAYRTAGYFLRGEFDRLLALYRGLWAGCRMERFSDPALESRSMDGIISQNNKHVRSPRSTPEERSVSSQGHVCGPRIRIAINAITDVTPNDGARIYLRALAQELAKLEGVEVILVVGKGQRTLLPSDLQAKACEVAVPHSRSYWQFFFQHRIRDALKHEQADVYHLPNRLPFLWKFIPTVVTIHHVGMRARKYGLMRTIYGFAVDHLAGNLCDHVMTVSESAKRDIAELLGLSESKITVVHNGVDSSFRVLDRASCKSRVKSVYSLDRDFILATGGLSRNKNVERLLLAFAELTRSGFQHTLALTGWGEPARLSFIKGRIHHLGLEGRVNLTGHVPRQDMPALYNACALAVYSSLYEGFGLPVLEAMACGTPLIVSNTSSLPEVAGDAALFVDPYDIGDISRAIGQLLSDQDLRSKLVSRGLDRVRQFTWRAAAEKTVGVYWKIAMKNKDDIPQADTLFVAGSKQ